MITNTFAISKSYNNILPNLES